MAGKTRGHARYPLDFLSRIGTHINGRSGIASLLAEIDPAGQLANEDEVNALEDFRFECRSVREGREHLYRTQIGVDAELFAELQQPLLRTYLCRGG